ncbi:hypothetical protein LOD99_8737 [Oopsacas minuta]|uniref:Uncharacterized protein n=1 Tax=Oopsacas minuta TaxID=111878 RepID=A0AAV7JFN6_9METZ|nr:hypothetical protein LOD99_8737 [Oopsacas minuta]
MFAKELHVNTSMLGDNSNILRIAYKLDCSQIIVIQANKQDAVKKYKILQGPPPPVELLLKTLIKIQKYSRCQEVFVLTCTDIHRINIYDNSHISQDKS